MLAMALEQKQRQYEDARVKELDEVDKIKQGIEKEKQDKINKKII